VVSTLSLGHLLLRFSIVNLPQKTSLKKRAKLSERPGPSHFSGEPPDYDGLIGVLVSGLAARISFMEAIGVTDR